MRNMLGDRLDMGFNLQNIGPNITYINEAQSDPLPMNLRAGMHFRALDGEYAKININADMNKLMADRDNPLWKRPFTSWFDDGFMSKRVRESIIYGVGTELIYWDMISLRAGYIYDRAGSIKGPSFGAGIQHQFPRFRGFFDFAMQQGGELVDFNHTFSIGFEF